MRADCTHFTEKTGREMRGNEQEDKSDRRQPNEREIRHKGRQERIIQEQ